MMNDNVTINDNGGERGSARGSGLINPFNTRTIVPFSPITGTLG